LKVKYLSIHVKGLESLVSHVLRLLGHIKRSNLRLTAPPQEKDGLGFSFVYDDLSENEWHGEALRLFP
jgi:hypothetical protein